MNLIQLLSDFPSSSKLNLHNSLSKSDLHELKRPKRKETASQMTVAISSGAKPSDQFMDRNANIRTKAANYLDSASTDFQDALCQLYIPWNNNFTLQKPSKRWKSVVCWN
jgi:hypothetical protein